MNDELTKIFEENKEMISDLIKESKSLNQTTNLINKEAVGKIDLLEKQTKKQSEKVTNIIDSIDIKINKNIENKTSSLQNELAKQLTLQIKEVEINHDNQIKHLKSDLNQKRRTNNLTSATMILIGTVVFCHSKNAFSFFKRFYLFCKDKLVLRQIKVA